MMCAKVILIHYPKYDTNLDVSEGVVNVRGHVWLH